MEKIIIKVSDKAYKSKPTVSDMKDIFYSYLKDESNKELSYYEIAKVLSKGHSVTLAEYERNCNSIKEECIKSLSCIALDIDGKDNKINIYEMVGLIYKKFGALPIIKYCTFSDTDNTRFRLIYRFENKVDVNVYKTFYTALQWKLNKYLDPQTKNANRSWAATNKNIEYCENDVPFSFSIMIKLINAYRNKLKREEVKTKVKVERNYTEYSENSYIKNEYKEEVIKILVDNIDIREFIPKHFGGTFSKKGNNLVGKCVFSEHTGDRNNESALVISKNIYTCFTHCGTGNIITAARKAYNIEHFSTVAFKLAKEYNFNIPEQYIKER